MEKRRLVFMVAILAALLFFTPALSRASELDELHNQITTKKEEIQRLEADAKRYRVEIQAKQATQKTLQGELKRIDNTIAKLRSDIGITERKIVKTELEIKATNIEIYEKELSIRKLQSGLASMVRILSEKEQEPLITLILRHATLSDFFSQLDSILFIKEKTLGALVTIKELKNQLSIKRVEAEEKKEELEDLEKSLGDHKKIQETTKSGKNELLKTTKNLERGYQALLAEQEKKRAALEEEITGIEEKIRVTIDSSRLPSRGKGVLALPLPDMILESCWGSVAVSDKNCITQFFGNTDFAKTGVYQGKGHNGIDLRADIGTQVFAAEVGTIEGTGDTDIGCKGASYGKWILIRHPNNLSTLYTHLLQVTVSPGRQIQRGSAIGYSGKTGYATGPHLHFTVFATQGVQIQSIRSRVCGRMMTLPVSATSGYLNPLDYL